MVWAVVTSNTSWSATFTYSYRPPDASSPRAVDGTGTATIDLGRPSRVCATVRKATAEGTLTVRMDPGESGTTTSIFGEVTVCGGKDFD